MKRIPVWKNVALLASTFVVIIVATFAWFYLGHRANTESFDVPVGNAHYIQISDKDNWSEDLEMEIGITQKFKELSGDGGSLFAPVYDVVKNASGGFSTQLVSFDQVNESQYYFEQTLDFRADIVQKIYLDSKSGVTAVDENGNSYIDGAIRIAFFEIDDDGNENLTCIWAPNSTVEYSSETNSFTRDGSVEPYYYYQKSITPVDPYTLEESNFDVAKVSTDGTDENGCGYNEEYKFMWNNGNQFPVNAPSILTIDSPGADRHFYKKLKLKVWLEGHDRECVSLLSGQQFTIKLQFTAQEVE